MSGGRTKKVQPEVKHRLDPLYEHAEAVAAHCGQPEAADVIKRLCFELRQSIATQDKLHERIGKLRRDLNCREYIYMREKKARRSKSIRITEQSEQIDHLQALLGEEDA